MAEKVAKDYQDVEARSLEQRNVEAEKEVKASEKASQEEEHKGVLTAFLTSLSHKSTNKQDAMDRCANFLAEYLNVPAAYIAVKKN